MSGRRRRGRVPRGLRPGPVPAGRGHRRRRAAHRPVGPALGAARASAAAIRSGAAGRCPGGFVEPDDDLDGAARRELEEETGVLVSGFGESVALGHIEQLRSYGAPGRDPRMRVVSVAYVGFTTHNEPAVAGSDAADVRLWAIDDLAIAGRRQRRRRSARVRPRADHQRRHRTLARQARVHDARHRVPRRAVHARRAPPRVRSGVGRSAARRELPAQGAVDARVRRTDRRHRADRRSARRALPARRARRACTRRSCAREHAGVYPGSFDPLTSRTSRSPKPRRTRPRLDRIDLTLSRVALGKEDGAHSSVDARARRDPARGADATVARGRDHRRAADRRHRRRATTSSSWVPTSGRRCAIPAWYGGDAARTRRARSPRCPACSSRPGPASTSSARRCSTSTPSTRTSRRRAPAPANITSSSPDARRRLLVDGNNVIGSRPDGWWRDRPGATRRLVAALQSLAARTGDEITVVFDGRPLADLAEGVHDGVRVAYARRAGSRRGRRPHRRGGRATTTTRRRSPSSRRIARSRSACATLGADVEGAGALTRELESERP